MNSPDELAAVLVGFSTVGFIVFFGVATFIPIGIELLTRKELAVQLLFHYPYRLVSKLRETWAISFLIVTSLLFVGTGLLSLLYFLLNVSILLSIAELVSVVIMILSVVFILYVSLCSIPTKEEDLRRIIKYTIEEQQKLEKEN